MSRCFVKNFMKIMERSYRRDNTFFIDPDNLFTCNPTGELKINILIKKPIEQLPKHQI